LSSNKPKWYLLEEFFTKESEVRLFEQEVAKVTKCVYLGSNPINNDESEIG